MLKNPRVLMLGEATQKLDSPAESRIRSALEKPLVGLTTVMIQEHGDICRHLDAIGELVKTGAASGGATKHMAHKDIPQAGSHYLSSNQTARGDRRGLMR